MTVSRTTGRWLVGAAVTFTVLAVGGGAFSVAAQLARERATTTTSAAVPAGGIDLGTASGELRVVATDRTDAAITWKMLWSFRRPHVSAQVEGNRLVVRDGCGVAGMTNCSVDIIVEVPTGTAVRAHSSSGQVRASGATGPLDLSTSSGSVSGSQLTTPLVEARSSSGDVRLDFAASPREVSARTSSGDVAIVVPHEAGVTYDVAASTSSGRSEVSVDTSRDSSRHLTARTSSGDVAVTY